MKLSELFKEVETTLTRWEEEDRYPTYTSFFEEALGIEVDIDKPLVANSAFQTGMVTMFVYESIMQGETNGEED